MQLTRQSPIYAIILSFLEGAVGYTSLGSQCYRLRAFISLANPTKPYVLTTYPEL